MDKAENIASLEQRIALLEAENERLRQRNAWLERQLFGSKRDIRRKGTDPTLPTLFDDEFEKAVEESAKVADKAADAIRSRDVKRQNSCSSRKGSRLVSYAGLREEWRTEYPEGIDINEFEVIGHDIERVIRRKEAEVWVDCIDRPVLIPKGRRDAEGSDIIQAPAVKSAVPGTHAHPEFMTSVILDKYKYHLPEYRQCQRMKSEGFALPTSTLNDWVHACGDHLYPLYMRQRQAVLRNGYVQIDEVPSNIADRKGSVRKGYNWQVLDAGPHSAGTYFHYEGGSRSGDIPKGLLKGYSGAVQTDGYGGYEFLEADENVTMLTCMAHIRRKFTDAENENPLATYFLDYLSQLYALEASLKEEKATPEQVRAKRQELAVPILTHLDEWMYAVHTKVTPSSLMGKALAYAYKRWPRVMRYTENGIYRIDNNPVESGNRKPVLGRKNYLFSQNDAGAEDNAIFYTFVESCEITGVDPRKWFETVLAKPLNAMSHEQLDALLPVNFKPDNNL